MHYFEAAVSKVYTGNKLFTYRHDNKLAEGSLLRVPFGKKQAWAIATKTVDRPTFDTKEVLEKPLLVLPKPYTALMKWMLEYYPDDNGSIVKLFLPNQLPISTKNPPLYPDGYNQLLPNPTQEQALVISQIRSSNNKRILLHGDTGTGKTRVFLEIAKDFLSDGKSVLILTPEIGLTPQLLHEALKYLNAPIVLTHSGLTKTRRDFAWQYALTCHKPSVFIAPRSGLFLPINNLGLIIIDEAHDTSFRQSQTPKYQALQVAGKLASLKKCLLMHSTATPNIDEYEIAQAHKFLILTMRQMAAGNKTYKTHLVDIKDRSLFSESPYLSDHLLLTMKKSLDNGEQSLLFLNRRGSARLVQCQKCGWQAVCPNCDLPLIYHHDRHAVRCHTCNHRQAAPNQCPNCQSVDLVFKVLGTKSLAEHVSQLLPSARIMRFDADSESDKEYYKCIGSLKDGLVDIIIGTQLITKGIDLPKLSVVGIINADSGLNLPDYRAEELTFQQLYQATGRAARGHNQGQLFIQTRVPDHPIMQAIKHRSWADFYSYELDKRRAYLYPPYTYLALLKITKKSPTIAEQKCLEIIETYRNALNISQKIQILGPSPAFHEKTAQGYTWQLLLKSSSRTQLLKFVANLPYDWKIDFDPSSIL